jgi:glycosyltransferase involved in cell wall biosynthesis
MKKALMMASVASMIDLFNMDNIKVLQGMGFEVHVACNFEYGSITSQERVDEFRKELEHNGIQTFHIPVPRSMSAIKDIIRSYTLMKKLCKEHNYQIVHCHSPIGGVVARMACRSVRKFGTNVIYTAHGFHFFKGASIKNWLLFYPVEKYSAKYTDILITINQEDLSTAKNFSSEKVVYVPGIGVHTEEFKNVQVDRKKKRAEFGFTDHDFVFMSTGQISKRKNQEVIIRALSLIKEKRVKYLIIGFGELEDKLKQLVKKLKVEDRVVFAGYRKDVKEILHAVDGFAFPSLQEGLPVALMEAMSVGLPVVCSNIRGNVDLIENGRGGYIYDHNDYLGFSEGMKQIIEGQNITTMKYINQSTIRRFDVTNVNNEMKKIYSSVFKEEEMNEYM